MAFHTGQKMEDWPSGTSASWLDDLYVNSKLRVSLCNTVLSPPDLRMYFGNYDYVRMWDSLRIHDDVL